MIIEQLFNRIREQRLLNHDFTAPSEDDLEYIGGVSFPTQSGQVVTVESSKNVATAYRCINILSDDIAKLPFQNFESLGIGQINRIPPDIRFQNIAWLLEISPNRWMTPLVFKKMAIEWLLTHGAAYIWNPPRSSGQRRELFVLRTDKTDPFFDTSGQLFYETEFASGEKRLIPDVEILVLLINSQDGITGRSVIRYARETIGRQLGAQETQGSFYRQGLNPGGIVWTAGEVSPEARKKLRSEYEKTMSGSDNAYRLAVFDNKITKFESITIPPRDAQFLESIQENDAQIANFFGMPLYKLNQGKQSYQSNEQQNLDYLNTTLDPYLVQWEQAAAIKWLSQIEQNTRYFRFNRDALLRTDSKSRAEYLEKKILSGQLSPNEARQIEDMPGYNGGDQKYMPLNFGVVAADGSLIIANQEESSDDT